MFKLNFIQARKEGLSRAEATAQASKNAATGLAKHIPFMAKMIARSLLNVGKYFSGADLKFAQDPAGLEMHIGEVLMEKLGNVAKLPFSEEFDHAHHGEEHEGLTREPDSKLEGGHEALAGLLANLYEENLEAGSADGSEVSGGAETEDDVMDRDTYIAAVRAALDAHDYEEAEKLARISGLQGVERFTATLRDFDDNARVDHSTEGHVPEQDLKDLLNPIEAYHRAFSINRIQNALGHNLGDVVNVFPFQAGCVPFLLPAFEGLVSQLEALDIPGVPKEKVKEIGTFMMIMVFSMFADNYVGCKVGLELMPDKPQIALIAAIQGGSMSAIGNMANIAQYNLEDFPLLTSFAKAKWHVDNVTTALIWSQVLGLLGNVPFFKTPEALQKASGHHAALNNAPEAGRMRTRGELLGLDAIRGVLSA